MYICTPSPNKKKIDSVPFFIVENTHMYIYIFFLGARDTRYTYSYLLIPTYILLQGLGREGVAWRVPGGFIRCRGFLHRTPDSSSSTQGPALLTPPNHPRPSQAQGGRPVQEPWRKQRIPDTGGVRFLTPTPPFVLRQCVGGEWNEATPTYLPPSAINA